MHAHGNVKCRGEWHLGPKTQLLSTPLLFFSPLGASKNTPGCPFTTMLFASSPAFQSTHPSIPIPLLCTAISILREIHRHPHAPALWEQTALRKAPTGTAYHHQLVKQPTFWPPWCNLKVVAPVLNQQPPLASPSFPYPSVPMPLPRSLPYQPKSVEINAAMRNRRHLQLK